MMVRFAEGQLITAPFLSHRAEVKKFEDRTGYYLLEVVLQDEHSTYKSLRITAAQLESIQAAEREQLSPTGDAEDFFLFIEANRIRLAYQFDPHLAVSISQVDPLPHQIEAVYHYVLPSPTVRFLIADDPGAGKTIMAGLVLKELQYRGLVRRVLIVAPGHLKYQWQREMKERFQTSFAIVDRARVESAWGENVWEETDHCITSIDFAKQDAIRSTLASTNWDLVVVDEAHKMSAYAYETKRGLKVDKTKRYQAGEVLSRSANHLLFLTATPHRGDEENFRLFLDLLRPGFFAQTELLHESVEAKDNPIFIRRLKEDMRHFDGRAIFPPRHIQSVKFRLSPAEIELYNGVTRYVQDYYDKARENRSISFAMVILQRRLTSSSCAIHRSLERRLERLGELLLLPDKIEQEGEDYLQARRISDEELEDMSEEDRARIEERLEHLTIARNIGDVKAEITVVERLSEGAERVREQEIESKLVHLRDQVLANLNGRKLIIFTEFRDTLDYLTGKLVEWGYAVNTIHGGMNMETRIEAESRFKHETQIMVATEAAGEGINLQFCSLMVNYDIPWNPNRLEQRMGRIHRYGQDREVFIWNMISRDTREGQILDRIFEKLARMREALGSDRVFDIIGEIIPGARLDDLIKDAIFNQRRMEEIEEQIQAVDETSVRRTMERVFLSGLATRHIDVTGIQQETLKAQENRLVPEYVEDYFLRAFRRLDGNAERRDGSFTIPSVPFELRRWGDDYRFKTVYGKVAREYRRVTFDKNVARGNPGYEFVAPGHPLLEAVNETILQRGSGEGYAAFGDPEGARQGLFWFVEGEVMDGTGQPAGRRVFCLYQEARTSLIQRVNPAILWDHEPLVHPEIQSEVEALLAHRSTVEDHIVTQVLLPFREEIAGRREREAQVKEKYGLRSLDYLIQESNQKLLDYQLRSTGGEQMEMPILNERRNLESLEGRRCDLEREIRLERNLTVSEPRVIGAAAVIPMPVTPVELETEPLVYEQPRPEPEPVNEERAAYTTGAGMRRDDEIEAVGMRVAMEHEQERGWRPEDVSGENHGFDVRSSKFNADGTFADIRYIEVKARARSGAIRLSANEWKKARQFGEKYWLYIVTQAGTDHPQLKRIPSPACQFELGEDIFATGFIIHEDKWQTKLSP